jgi:hypothetical protein
MKGKTILLATAAAAMMATTAMPANAGDWWENTSINGRMYYDFTNIDQKVNGVSTSKSGTSFDIKRFYVGIDHKFNNVFSANITTDTQYDSTAGHSNIYIKKAYLQAKLMPELTIRLGSADMPWIPFVEGVYGYRYVENTLIDRTHYGNSADWGAYALGKFAHGLFSYEIAVVNGAGYHKMVRTDGVDIEGRLSAHFNNITLAVGGYTGKRGAAHGTTTYHTANRFDALAAYTTKKIRVGFEYFKANDWNNVTTMTKDSSDGYSVFASYQFAPEWGIFGRYDWVNRYNDTDPKYQDNYYNAGIAFTPFKMIDFALVYKHDGNGLTPFHAKVKYDEVGLFGRLRW